MPNPGCTILHLSDLHFGQTLKPPNNELLTKKGLSEEFAKSFAQNLIKSRKSNPRIDAIIITGDITNNAKYKEFENAETFLSTLLNEL